jgi:glycyl-tRNA synthetase
MKLPLFSAPDQESGAYGANTDITLREALDQGVLKNETMAYFLARTYLFLTEVGIKSEGIRFR